MDNINEDNETDPMIDSEDFDASGVDDTSQEPAPPYTPPAPPWQGEDRLVRDPQATFAGVLSGFAHRYGFDVSLTRLAYIVLTFVSGGITVPLYFLAWIIVPRARFWPPVKRSRTRSLSGRDVGFGLIGLATLVALAVGTGEAAAVIVPLGLIIGGVWLLVQNPRSETALAGAAAAPSDVAPPGVVVTERSAFGDQTAPQAASSWTTPQMPSVAPEPAVPRSRRRRFVVFALIGAVLLIPLLIVGGIVAALVTGDFDIDFNDKSVVVPIGVDDIPTRVDIEGGEYLLDLTNTDLSPLGQADFDPLEVDIDINAGRIEVIVPNDLPVDVDARVDAIGDVTVFGQNDDGFDVDVSSSDDDPQLILDLSVDVGEIEVTRSN